MIVKGERRSLNELADQLKDNGINYSNDEIYKVLMPKQVLEQARQNGTRLIEYVSVEASCNVFKDEACLTIYLRDMTEYVKAIKDQLKTDK